MDSGLAASPRPGMTNENSSHTLLQPERRRFRASRQNTASTSSSLFEIYDDAASAIAREKDLKKWRRDWKTRLIEEQNLNWDDLYPGIAN